MADVTAVSIVSLKPQCVRCTSQPRAAQLRVADSGTPGRAGRRRRRQRRQGGRRRLARDRGALAHGVSTGVCVRGGVWRGSGGELALGEWRWKPSGTWAPILDPTYHCAVMIYHYKSLLKNGLCLCQPVWPGQPVFIHAVWSGQPVFSLTVQHCNRIREARGRPRGRL